MFIKLCLNICKTVRHIPRQVFKEKLIINNETDSCGY